MGSVNRDTLHLINERLQAGTSEDERLFLEAAEMGDIDTIKRLLNEERVTVNCVDQTGRTAIELAVAAGDEDIVSFLLNSVSDTAVHRALLCAAEADRERICEQILQHPAYANAKILDEVEEEPEVDPIVLKLLKEGLLRAAVQNDFQIVKKFIIRGAFLDKPHDYFCSCSECTEGKRKDYKVYTTNRLDTFRAMASPAYLSLTEKDPIMAAFNLSQKFRRLAELEGEYKQMYYDLDNQCQNYTLALLEQCLSSDEVKALLTGRSHIKSTDDQSESEDGEQILPLLGTAITMEQKKFVAHNQCQSQITELWYSGVPALRYLNKFSYLMLSIPIGVVLVPILSIIYLIAPWSRVSNILQTPLMRFLSYTCSYLTFLVVVMVTKLELMHTFDSFACDDPAPFALAVVILVVLWILGLIWEECKQIMDAGAADYFSSIWNCIDSTMLSLLLASFALELVIPLRLQHVLSSGSGDNATLPPICKTLRGGQEDAALFCSVGRASGAVVVWEPSWVPDPELLSDILFTIGTILSIGRFSFIMPANEALGTMLVSFRRTLMDLFKLLGMFVLVMIAFTCGMAALYAPNKCMNESFGTFGSSLYTLFWSLIGMGDTAAPSLTKDGPLASLTNNPLRNYGVETVGFFLYSSYVFISMVVLMNLLIAVMSNTFQEIQDERDIEWKFARTELWLSFIVPGCPVPAPFNVIPSTKTILDAIVWLFQKCCGCCCKLDGNGDSCCCNFPPIRWIVQQLQRIGYCKTGESEQEKVKYTTLKDDETTELSETDSQSHGSSMDLMCILIRRYVRQAEREKEEGNDDAAEDMMKKHIERTGAKIEKRVEQLYERLGSVEYNMSDVQKGESDIVKLQLEHLEMSKLHSENRERQLDKFLHTMGQTKLELLSRMDAERIEINRLLEVQKNEMMKKWDEEIKERKQRVQEISELQAKRRQLIAEGNTDEAAILDDEIATKMRE
ncbi:short transient receptor potential channel 7 isoform X1 [Patella vulgata]|uniref:short transient receptor potential channel 7 isoform X1 n=1 Tax=Patella vulgata TaxID=6465 RepID=UPI00217F4330|nr:short transient receptor potential channel 7 isoform X1 [Patella vulgata]XP_050413147.1 short transient receptor potential channel 7 isoform X1 [Patella vulgata]XP_050413148.1 short transient receptor potential channel 7 isoform X1 [Patella vulgata]